MIQASKVRQSEEALPVSINLMSQYTTVINTSNMAAITSHCIVEHSSGKPTFREGKKTGSS